MVLHRSRKPAPVRVCGFESHRLRSRPLQVSTWGAFLSLKGHQDRQFTALDIRSPERSKVWVRAERSELISAETGCLVSASRLRITEGDRRSIPPAPLCCGTTAYTIRPVLQNIGGRASWQRGVSRCRRAGPLESYSVRLSEAWSSAYGRAKATTASPRRSPHLPCPPAATTTYCRSPAS